MQFTFEVNEYLKRTNTNLEDLHEIELKRLVNAKTEDLKNLLNDTYVWTLYNPSSEELKYIKTGPLGDYLNKLPDHLYYAISFRSPKEAKDYSLKLIREITVGKNENSQWRPPFITLLSLPTEIFWLGSSQKAVNDETDPYVVENTTWAILKFSYSVNNNGIVPPELINKVLEFTKQYIANRLPISTSYDMIMWDKRKNEEYKIYNRSGEIGIQVANSQINNTMTYKKIEDELAKYQYVILNKEDKKKFIEENKSFNKD